MQQSNSSNSVTEFEQPWGGWTTLLNRFYDEPKAAQLMNTRLGQYLSSHPFFAVTVLLFSTMAALPVGLFLTFALVTIIISVVGFVFFEVFLLFVGGLTLLSVLSGIAFFSVMASFIFKVLYVTISNILNHRYPQLIKKGEVQEKESERATSKQEEMH